MVQLDKQIVEIKVVAFASNDGVHLPPAMQDPALKYRHVGGVDALLWNGLVGIDALMVLRWRRAA